MIVQLTIAIVVNPGTAAADSSRVKNDQFADCKPERAGLIAYTPNGLRYLLAVRVSEGPSTEKLAKAKESSVQFQEMSNGYLRDDSKLQRDWDPRCKKGLKRRTVVGGGLASDRQTVMDDESDANCTTVRQRDRGFGLVISTGAPAFRY